MTTGLRFIGTIKTATKEFPMQYLGSRIMATGRGDRHGLVSHDKEAGVTLLAFFGWIETEGTSSPPAHH